MMANRGHFLFGYCEVSRVNRRLLPVCTANEVHGTRPLQVWAVAKAPAQQARPPPEWVADVVAAAGRQLPAMGPQVRRGP